MSLAKNLRMAEARNNNPISRAGRIEAAVWTYRGWVCMLGKVLEAAIADPCKVGYEEEEEETSGVSSTVNCSPGNFRAGTSSPLMTRERAAANCGLCSSTSSPSGWVRVGSEMFRVANTRDPIPFAEAPRHPPTVAAS